jgi:hypothetical protein
MLRIGIDGGLVDCLRSNLERATGTVCCAVKIDLRWVVNASETRRERGATTGEDRRSFGGRGTHTPRALIPLSRVTHPLTEMMRLAILCLAAPLAISAICKPQAPREHVHEWQTILPN